jgi:hypothetical protein
MKMERKAYNYFLASVFFVENVDEIVEFENVVTRFLETWRNFSLQLPISSLSK